mgnify:CR=1 FL=1
MYGEKSDYFLAIAGYCFIVNAFAIFFLREEKIPDDGEYQAILDDNGQIEGTANNLYDKTKPGYQSRESVLGNNQHDDNNEHQNKDDSDWTKVTNDLLEEKEKYAIIDKEKESIEIKEKCTLITRCKSWLNDDTTLTEIWTDLDFWLLSLPFILSVGVSGLMVVNQDTFIRSFSLQHFRTILLLIGPFVNISMKVKLLRFNIEPVLLSL